MMIDEKMVRETWAETRAEALAALRPGERHMNWCAHVDLPPNPTSANPAYDAKGYMVMFSIRRSASGELSVMHGDLVLEPAPAAASTEIPRYRCIKSVRALEIEHIDTSGPGLAQIILVGHPPRRAKEGMFHRYMPRAGDFLVIYDDGYESISPRKAFLEGYVLEEKTTPFDPADHIKTEEDRAAFIEAALVEDLPADEVTRILARAAAKETR